MLTKTYPLALVKTGEQDGLADDQFEALVSVFGNKDSYGDVVMPGAFTQTLADWKASGDPIPVYWSHRMDDPDYNIGHVITAVETGDGLVVTAQLDLDSPKAAQVYRLLKSRRVTQFSFAYDVIDGVPAQRDGEDVYELRTLKLYEIGPTPIGANPDTELLDVKTVRGKAGRVLSAKNETTLRAARDQLTAAVRQLDDVLSALDQTGDDSEKAVTPAGRSPAEVLILANLALAEHS